MYVELSLSPPVAGADDSSPIDPGGLIGLAQLTHEFGLVMGMSQSIKDWTAALSKMDGTSAQLWKQVLLKRGVGPSGVEGTCRCGRLNGFRFWIHNQNEVSVCCGQIHSPHSAMLNGIWMSKRTTSNTGLSPSENYPASFDDRFKSLILLSRRMILIDPYICPDSDRSIKAGVEPPFFRLLTHLNPGWSGSIDIACRTVKGWGRNAILKQMSQLLDTQCPNRQFEVNVLTTSSHLHDRAIGFQIGSTRLSVSLGKGLEPFSKNQRKMTYHCEVTGDQKAHLLWDQATQLDSAKVETI